MENSYLKFDNISFNYPRSTAGLTDFELNICESGKMGCLGNNGSGKSTFIKLLTGLLHPSSGEVFCLGQESRKRHSEMLREVYFIPEEFTLPEMNSNQFLKIYSKFYPKFDTDKFEQTIEIFKLKKELDLRKLSFGQKKKFLLSFALAANTKILVLDEPGNGLDISSRVELRNLLHRENCEDRLFILSTHQLSEISDILDSILIIREGRCLGHLSLEEINRKFICLAESDDGSKGRKSLFFRETVKEKIHLFERLEGETGTVDLEIFFLAAHQAPTLLNRPATASTPTSSRP